MKNSLPPKKKAKSKRVPKPDGAAIGKALAKAVMAATPPEPPAPPTAREEAKAAKESHKAERLAANGGKPPQKIEVWYDDFGKTYLYNLQGRLRVLPKSEIKLHLQSVGLSNQVYFDGVTEADWPFLHALNDRFVDYAGSLPGHRVGLFKDASGRRILVTDEAAGVFEPLVKLQKEPSFIPSFLAELLGENDQWMHLCYSLAVGLRSLRAQDWRPAPCTFIIGKKDCGKSLLQYIIRQIYGGRVASPYLAMCAGGKFNGELMTGECWSMEDPHLESHMNARLGFAAKIKEYFHNEEFTFHDKGKRAFTVPCFRRGFNSVNDEPEDYQPLPPMRDGVSDKITFYRCARASESLRRFAGTSGRMADGVDRNVIKKAIADELPQVRAWLMGAFQNVPEKWQDSRYGVAAYHHPDLLRELGELSPEARFLSYVDEVLFRVGHGDAPSAHWQRGPVDSDAIECGAKDLERRMMTSEFKGQVEKGIHLTGKNLGRLAMSHPHRITRRVLDGNAIWKINNPFRQQQEMTHAQEE